MADKNTTSLATGVVSGATSAVASSNAAINLPFLNLTVSGDDDLDTRLDRLEQFAKAADDELSRLDGATKEDRELAQRAVDDTASAEARMGEVDTALRGLEDRMDRLFARLDPDALNAKLDKIENDNALILDRPAFDPSTLVLDPGAYEVATDNFPRGLLAYIVETYHRGDVGQYNRDLAATEERKAREAAAS